MPQILSRGAASRLALTLALPLMVAAPLAGCSGMNGGGAAAQSPAGLPITTATVTENGKQHSFRVEVARTEAEQAQGLMDRASLDPDAGMIFPLTPERPASFWMKNTRIPLDIFFVRRDGSIDRIAENTTPMSLEPIVSGGDVALVLEVAGGTAARLNLTEAAKVTWKPLESK